MRISASYSKKAQIKQYEPVEISCFIEEELTDNENPSDFYRKQFNFCKEQVDKRIELETASLENEEKDTETKSAEIKKKSRAEVETEFGQTG